MSDNTQELIKNILELRVSPVLQAHGGHISFVDYKDGVVWVELQGACNGCSGALNTLHNNIEGFLKAMVPEITAVKDIHLSGDER